jgi:hypothetical protein
MAAKVTLRVTAVSWVVLLVRQQEDMVVML